MKSVQSTVREQWKAVWKGHVLAWIGTVGNKADVLRHVK